MKLSSIKTFTYSILLLTIVLSCESDDGPNFDTNDNFVSYFFFYDSDLDRTTITAEIKKLNVLNDNFQLESDETVTFNGDELMFDEQSVSYSRSYEGLIKEGDFVYSSSEGRVYSAALLSYQSIEFPNDFATLSKSEGATVEWVGNGLEEFESLIVVIGEYEEGQELGTFHDELGSESVDLARVTLEILPLGFQPAYIQRNKVKFLSNEEGEAPIVGGRIVVEYRSKTIQVELVE
ncbi:hypothetical protein [Ekhidna sp.]